MTALEAILASEKFVAAPQMSAFLRYVVEQAASGNKFRIKAYTVAVDALGKPDSFDPQNDPVVRVLAGRLRSSLTAYHENNPDADIIIEMKPGSYVPVFILKEGSSDAAEPIDEEAWYEDDMDHSATAANSVISEFDLTLTTASDEDQVQSASSVAAATPDDSAPSSDRANTPLRQRACQLGRSCRQLSDNYPKLSLTAALLMAFLVGLLTHRLGVGKEPVMQAASSMLSTQFQPLARQRPDSLSLFIGTTEPADKLLNQLTTMMSGVFSKSEDVRVYRMMRTAQSQRFWPEDYLVTVNVVPLPDETQVSVQLVDAQTGRISHMEILHLSQDAIDRLSADELKIILECARFLISEQGPLRSDYQTKING